MPSLFGVLSTVGIYFWVSSVSQAGSAYTEIQSLEIFWLHWAEGWVGVKASEKGGTRSERVSNLLLSRSPFGNNGVHPSLRLRLQTYCIYARSWTESSRPSISFQGKHAVPLGSQRPCKASLVQRECCPDELSHHLIKHDCKGKLNT